MMNEVLPSDPSVQPFLALVGAQTRRTVKIETATSYQCSDYWSEGSRNEATFVELATMRTVPATALPGNNAFGLADRRVDIPEGYAVLEHCIFQGKDLGYRLYLHPRNITPLLVSKPSDVDPRDRKILEAFRSLKSGPYRQETLAALGFTIADRDRLASRGLIKVSSNGATQITLEGKQASR